MKTLHRKAIYNPSGRAGEYSQWACNFYVGCSNDCEYCYCKKGILSGVMGQDQPQLKKCFRDEDNALAIFKKELIQNLEELRQHGLFFSFTTDPLLPGTTEYLTYKAAEFAIMNRVPVKILTKCAGWVDDLIYHVKKHGKSERWLELSVFGFTLTGHDELEPGASTNAERITAMKKLHAAGFRTFASIEPVIDTQSSMDMIAASDNYCDLFKVGLMSGKKYERAELYSMVEYLMERFPYRKFYFKDSLLKQTGISRSDLPDNCVERDYNIFKL